MPGSSCGTQTTLSLGSTTCRRISRVGLFRSRMARRSSRCCCTAFLRRGQVVVFFWQVRDIQAMLTLQLTGRTSSRWISSQWDSWTSLLNEYTGIDIDAHCLRNHNSQAAREAAGHAAATGAQQTMLEFSVSTFCLLGLLSRWAGTLKRQGGSEASRVLRHLLASVLPAAAVMVPVRAFGEDFDISSSWPACSTSGVAGHIRLQGGLVFVPAHIIAAVPDLRSGLARIVL